ncbi:MAG: IS66 family transposase [Gemmataceae bacterium]|nr:IS66 family transposase [Gemmataceae bacterium]
MDQFERLVERLKVLGADEKDTEILQALFASYEYVTELIQDERTTIRRLRELLHGAKPKTEKTKAVVGQTAAEPPAPSCGTGSPSQPPRKGHGRNGAERYVGAERIAVPHESLHPGDPCPHCRGRLYPQKQPALLVRIRASAPFSAKVYEKQRLRCNLCGELFTARSPEGVGEQKYDEGVASMVALLRYGSGLPWHRIEGLQASLGVPLPASVQWELVRDAAQPLQAAHDELVRLAAQGQLLYNDDTAMRILEYLKEDRERVARGEKLERTGTFTSGIVSEVDGRQIVLYFTGRCHAGENLAALLAQRAAGLEPPLQMCDALERNLPGELKTIVSNCLTHGRRHFVEVVESFPAEVRHVLEELGLVYHNDEQARSKGMSPEQRLRWHQQHSGPVMERLKEWMDALIRDKTVEPNSGLGKAIAYAQKRWVRMTLFLRQPGAPLDNSLCERMLKRAILHRKNSLFYKTANGAKVGDLFMSLIATAKLAKVDPFDYLNQLQRHAQDLAAHPADWMPWSYRGTLARAREPA